MSPSPHHSSVSILETKITQSPEEAAEFILRGGIVVFPTETVYGIGASALNWEACRKIYEIKNRPKDNPLIVHFSDISSIERVAHLPNQGRLLLERFAPGPLTLVLKKKEESIFTSGYSTIAVRIPSGEGLREILIYCNQPIAAPSANPSGKPSITRNQDAIDTFQGLVDCILIGHSFRNPIGLESTVVDVTTSTPKILRPGAIDIEELEEVLGAPISISKSMDSLSPGVKYKHYSPEAKVLVFSNTMEGLEAINQNQCQTQKLGILCYYDTYLEIKSKIHLSSWMHCHRVSSNEEYARDLYSFFLECDRLGVEWIFCQEPREGRFQLAIKNRLEKASNSYSIPLSNGLGTPD